MSLEVIGAGIGRTGTESLKLALEQLGFGKCYHMVELIRDPYKVDAWETLAEGGKPDLKRLFEGYRSAVDLPAALYYRELMSYYPEAKVILTIRDPDKWYASASKTIFRPLTFPMNVILPALGMLSKRLRYVQRVIAFAKKYAIDGFFEGATDNAERCKAIFNAHNKTVQETVPAHQLLVFNVKEGWEPLCKFLEVPVPVTPFPHSNTGKSFRRRTQQLALRKE